MSLKVIVFDFDGTLVDSNRIKYNAFFDLFDNNQRDIIKSVLSDMYEESRFVIIEEILKRRAFKGDLEKKTNELVRRYNKIVVKKVKKCSEIKNASEILKLLYKDYILYLSSTTPQVSLLEIVEFRQWGKYFKGIYGYPNKKIDTLKFILNQEKICNKNMLVVGDGYSDKESAGIIDCNFYQVNNNLNELIDFIKKIK